MVYFAFGLEVEHVEQYYACMKFVGVIYYLKYPHDVYEILDAIKKAYEKIKKKIEEEDVATHLPEVM